MEQSKPEEVVTPAPEAAPAAPATPAAKPGPSKKTWMIVAVVAVVAVVVIAAIVLGTGMLSSDDGDDGDDGGNGGTIDTWEPQSGDFLEYTSDMLGMEMVMKQTYKEVTSTTITLNTSTTFMGFTDYNETTINKDQDYGGADFDVSDPPSGYNVVNKGKQSISTNWGSKSCDHYEVTFTDEFGTPGTMDMWLYHGILIKSEISGGGMSIEMVLSDTNIDTITG